MPYEIREYASEKHKSVNHSYDDKYYNSNIIKELKISLVFPIFFFISLL